MRARPKKTEEYRWGYAVAGIVALAFASLIQFALAELPHDVLKYVPIGKLALTVPLAAWGVALIARDLVANFGRPTVRISRARSERAQPAPRPQEAEPMPDSDVVPSEELALESVSDEELDLEVGEPLEEETGPKIPALRGRFTWLLGDESYKPGARRGEA
jgi:hypothetical protein